MMAEDEHQSRNCFPLSTLEDPNNSIPPMSAVNSESPGTVGQLDTGRQKKRQMESQQKQKGNEGENQSDCNSNSCLLKKGVERKTSSSSDCPNIPLPVPNSASASQETADTASQIKTTKTADTASQIKTTKTADTASQIKTTKTADTASQIKTTKTADTASQIKTMRKKKKDKGKEADNGSDCNNKTSKKRMKQKVRPAVEPSLTTAVSASRVVETGHESVWSKLGVLKCEKCGFTTDKQALFNCHICGIRKPRTFPQHQVSLNALSGSKKLSKQVSPSVPKKRSISMSSIGSSSVAETSKRSKYQNDSSIVSSSTSDPLANQKRFLCIQPETAPATADISSLSPPTCLADLVMVIPTHVTSEPYQAVAQSTPVHTTPSQEACSLIQQPGVALSVASQSTATVDSDHLTNALAVASAKSMDTLKSDGETSAFLVVSSQTVPTLDLDPETIVQDDQRQGFVRYDDSTGNFVCMQCNYTVCEGIGLTEHLLYQLVANPYCCRHCAKEFPSRVMFQQHFAEEHKGKKAECMLHNVRSVKRIVREAKEAAKLGKSQPFPLHSTFVSCITIAPTLVNPAESWAPESIVPSSSLSFSEKSTCASSLKTICLVEKKDNADQEPGMKNDRGNVDLFTESTKKKDDFLKIVSIQGNYTEREDNSVEPFFIPQTESGHVGEASALSRSSPDMLNSTVSVPVTSEAVSNVAVPLPVIATSAATQVPVNCDKVCVTSEAVHNQTGHSVASDTTSQILSVTSINNQTDSTVEKFISTQYSSPVSHETISHGLNSFQPLHESGTCDSQTFREVSINRGQNIQRTLYEINSHASNQANPQSSTGLVACGQGLAVYDLCQHRAVLNPVQNYRSSSYACWQGHTSQSPSFDRLQSERESCRRFGTPSDIQNNSQGNSLSVESGHVLHSNTVKTAQYSIVQNSFVVNAVQKAVNKRLNGPVRSPSATAIQAVHSTTSLRNHQRTTTASDSVQVPVVSVIESETGERYSPISRSSRVMSVADVTDDSAEERYCAIGPGSHVPAESVREQFEGKRYSPVSPSTQVSSMNVTERNVGGRYSPVSPIPYVPEVSHTPVTESNGGMTYSSTSPAARRSTTFVAVSSASSSVPLQCAQIYSPITPPPSQSASVTNSLQPLDMSLTGTEQTDMCDLGGEATLISTKSDELPPRCASSLKIEATNDVSASVEDGMVHVSSLLSTATMADKNIADPSASAAAIGVSSSPQVMSDSQTLASWNGLFVKFYNSYACLPCGKRYQDKQNFYDHVWSHMHPKRQQCAHCIDTANHSCLKTTETIDSVSPCVDRNIVFMLKNNCRNKLLPKLFGSESSPFYESDGDSVELPVSTAHHHGQPTSSGDGPEICGLEKNCLIESEKNIRVQSEVSSDPCFSAAEDVGSDSNIDTRVECREAERTDDASQVNNCSSSPYSFSFTMNDCTEVKSDVAQEERLIHTGAGQRQTGNHIPQGDQDPEEENIHSIISPSSIDRTSWNKHNMEKESMKSIEEDMDSVGIEEEDADTNKGFVVDSHDQVGQQKTWKLIKPAVADSIEQAPDRPGHGRVRSVSLDTGSGGESSSLCKASERPCLKQTEALSRCSVFFICSLCSFSCDTAVDFTMHLNADHHSENSFPCYHCNYQGQYTTDLTDHINSHTMGDKNIYLCPCVLSRCSFKTDSLHNLRLHMENHQDCTLFTCHRCDSTFMNGKEFLQHAQDNSITVYTCTRCAARFLEKTAIQQHWRTRHKLGSLCYRVVKVLLCWDRKTNAYNFDTIVTLNRTTDAHSIKNSTSDNAESAMSLPVVDVARPVLENFTIGADSHIAEPASGDHISHVPNSHVLVSVSETSPSVRDPEWKGHTSQKHSDEPVAVRVLPTKLVVDVGDKRDLKTPEEADQDFMPARLGSFILPEKPNGSNLPASTTTLSVVEGHSLENEDIESQKLSSPVEENMSDDAENTQNLPASTTTLSVVEGHSLENEDIESQKLSSPVEENMSDDAENTQNLPASTTTLSVVEGHSLENEDIESQKLSSPVEENMSDDAENTQNLPASTTTLSVVEGHSVENEDIKCSQKCENAMDENISDHAENPPSLCIVGQEDTDILFTTGDQNCLSDHVVGSCDHGILQMAESAALTPEPHDGSISETTASSYELAHTIVSQTTAMPAESCVIERQEMVRLTGLFGSNEINNAFLGHLYHENGGLFCCCVCDKKLDGHDRIQEHLFTHFRVPLYSCCFCLYQSSYRRDMRTHVSQNHPDQMSQKHRKQKTMVNCLMVHRGHLFQTFEKEKPLTVSKFQAICQQLKDDNKHSRNHSGSCGLMVEKDSDSLANREAETAFPDRHEIGTTSVIQSSAVHSSADTKRSSAAACTEKVAAFLKISAVQRSDGVGHCGVKSCKRSMLSLRRESAAEKKPRDSEAQFGLFFLNDSPQKVHMLATTSQSSKKLKQKSIRKNSTVQQKFCARPKTGTYTVVKMGAMRKLKCKACGKMTLSLNAMSEHLKTCAHYLNTQSVSEHTGHARSLAEQMQVKKFPLLNLKSMSSNSKTKSDHSRHNESLDSASLEISGKQYKPCTMPQTQEVPSKIAECIKKARHSSKKAKNVEQCHALDSEAAGYADSLDDISLGLNNSQSVRKNSKSDAKEDQAAERRNVNVNIVDKKSDEDSEVTGDVLLHGRRTRKKRIHLLSFDSDEDEVEDDKDIRNAKETTADSEQIFLCKHCDFAAPRSHKDELRNHLQKQHQRLLCLTKCGYCSSPYGNLTILKRHIKSVHPGKPELQEQVQYHEFFKLGEEENCSSQNQLEQQSDKHWLEQQSDKYQVEQQSDEHQVEQQIDRVTSEPKFPDTEDEGFNETASGSAKVNELSDDSSKVFSSFSSLVSSNKLLTTAGEHQAVKDMLSPSASCVYTCSLDTDGEGPANQQTSITHGPGSVSKPSSEVETDKKPPSDPDGKNNSTDGSRSIVHKFQCLMCCEKLEDQKSLYAHLCEHLDYHPVRCGLCLEQAATVVELEKHHSMEHPGKSLVHRCVYIAEKEAELNRLLNPKMPERPVPHQMEGHTEVDFKQSIQCQLCQVWLDSLDQFRKHSIADHGVRNISTEMHWMDADSQIVYDLSGRVVGHTDNGKISSFNLLCGFCSHRFSNRFSASEHVRNSHGGTCSWIVKLCSISTSRPVTAVNAHSPHKSVTTTNTHDRNVETPSSGAMSSSHEHRQAVGDCGRREIPGYGACDSDLKIVLTDFLSPHQIHKFQTLLQSNGITSFHIGDSLSAEAQAYFMKFIP